MLNTRELGGPQPEGVGESGRKGKGGGDEIQGDETELQESNSSK